MILRNLSLQNFRSYTKKEFTFSPDLTIIIGPNTAGKTNLMEAITMLLKGKSNRSEKDTMAVQFEKEIARVKGTISSSVILARPESVDTLDLEVILTNGMVAGVAAPLRRFLVNGVAKRRVDFASHLSVVSFAPGDLDIISGGPSLRRAFLDDALEQVDRQYRIALITYTKALRQRNALLDRVKETGQRFEKQFEYWDQLLIANGQYISEKRELLIQYINNAPHDVFPFVMTYDHSLVSVERLLQYKTAEASSGVTLVGPHRDDFLVELKVGKELRNVKSFGSRGQQRLAILQLKMLQLSYMEEQNKVRPLLLLDDIFSELDNGHIALVQSLLDKQQTIMTTTHKEFLDKKISDTASVVELVTA